MYLTSTNDSRTGELRLFCICHYCYIAYCHIIMSTAFSHINRLQYFIVCCYVKKTYIHHIVNFVSPKQKITSPMIFQVEDFWNVAWTVCVCASKTGLSIKQQQRKLYINCHILLDWLTIYQTYDLTVKTGDGSWLKWPYKKCQPLYNKKFDNWYSL